MLPLKKIIVLGCFLLSSCAPKNAFTIVALTATVTVSTPVNVAEPTLWNTSNGEILNPGPTLIPMTLRPINIATLTPINIAAPTNTVVAGSQIVLQTIAGYSSYADLTGALWIVGEVGTDGTIDVQNAQITVSLLDNHGSVVAVGSGLVRYIPANSKFPFRVSINNAPKEWKGIKIQAQGSPYNDQSITPVYTDLRADNVIGMKSNIGYELSGEIINTGTKTAIQVDVVAAAYTDCCVIDVGSTRIGEIVPGGASPFTLVFSNLSQAPPSYWVCIVSSSK